MRHDPQQLGLDATKTLVKLMMVIASLFVVLSILSKFPDVAIICCDFILSFYLSMLFANNMRYIFLLHPLLALLFSQFFVSSFVELGDGLAYQAVVNQYFDAENFNLDAQVVYEQFGMLGFLKYSSLGVLPIFAIPDYFFKYPSDEIYYLWQNTFHLLLLCISISIVRIWNVTGTATLFSIAIFSALAPSFFDLGSAPTRHILTFFGIFMLFFSYQAVGSSITFGRIFCLIFSIGIVIASKWMLMLPFILYVVVTLVTGKKVSFRNGTIGALTALSFSFIFPDLLAAFVNYRETSETGAGFFSGVANLPIVGWVVKYMYALLAPFPWSNARDFISWNYGGNWLLFVMHVFSSLMGLYMFLIIILKFKYIVNGDPVIWQMVIYVLVMSLSILRGSIGFHTYILIYFPFLAPLLSIASLQIPRYYPIVLILTLEVLMKVVR